MTIYFEPCFVCAELPDPQVTTGLLCKGCRHNQRAIELLSAPIPMILVCPGCDVQHVDEDEWTTRSHRTHLCGTCGHEWRPSNRSTVGVESL